MHLDITFVFCDHPNLYVSFGNRGACHENTLHLVAKMNFFFLNIKQVTDTSGKIQASCKFWIKIRLRKKANSYDVQNKNNMKYVTSKGIEISDMNRKCVQNEEK